MGIFDYHHHWTVLLVRSQVEFGACHRSRRRVPSRRVEMSRVWWRPRNILTNIAGDIKAKGDASSHHWRFHKNTEHLAQCPLKLDMNSGSLMMHQLWCFPSFLLDKVLQCATSTNHIPTRREFLTIFFFFSSGQENTRMRWELFSARCARQAPLPWFWA